MASHCPPLKFTKAYMLIHKGNYSNRFMCDFIFIHVDWVGSWKDDMMLKNHTWCVGMFWPFNGIRENWTSNSKGLLLWYLVFHLILIFVLEQSEFLKLLLNVCGAALSNLFLPSISIWVSFSTQYLQSSIQIYKTYVFVFNSRAFSKPLQVIIRGNLSWKPPSLIMEYNLLIWGQWKFKW